MKTEERHKLQENVLAKEITVVSDKVREHGGTVAMIVGIGMIIYAAAAFWNSHRATVNEEAWDAYQTAIMEGDPEYRSLRRVADSDEYTGAEMQEWAYLTWADRQLLLASQQYLTDRDAAMKRLENVAAVYDQFSTGAVNPEIRNRARLGLGRVNEMQDRLDDARKEYNLVEGALGEYAAKRAAQLESKQVQADAKWLATAALPKPSAAKGPGTPGLRPSFEASTPAVDGTIAPIDSGATLEDIIGQLGEPPSDDDEPRYGEEKAGEAGADGQANPADEPADGGASEQDQDADAAAPEDGKMPAQP